MLAKEKLENEWMEFRLTKSIEIRNSLVLRHLHLVKIIVRRLIPLYRNHVEYDDFYSYGIFGLIDAIEKYDYTKGVKFETYASIRIRGSIIDNLREQDWVSTYLRQKLTKMEHAFEYMEQNGYSTTEEDVAGYMNINLKEFKSLMVDYRATNIVYLDEMVSSKTYLYTVDKDYEPEECYERKEIKEMLIDQMELLSSKEKTVIMLYYFKNLRLKEIGDILGISESRVSQIHSNTITKLRTRIFNLMVV